MLGPNDLRPISPILSRLVERMVVRDLIMPHIPPADLTDQFGFKPSGSTEDALIDLTHTISVMREDNKYVRCLMIDFSKAFDTVNHAILIMLMKKLVEYGLDQYVIEWVLSFLSDRTQFTKVGTKSSGMKAINLSIVQGSGVGQCLFIILIAD